MLRIRAYRYAAHSHRTFTPHIHTAHSHRALTPRTHTAHSHTVFTPHIRIGTWCPVACTMPTYSVPLSLTQASTQPSLPPQSSLDHASPPAFQPLSFHPSLPPFKPPGRSPWQARRHLHLRRPRLRPHRHPQPDRCEIAISPTLCAPPPFPYPPSLHLPSFSTGTSGFSKISFEGLAAVAMRSPYSGSLNVVRAAMDDPLVVGGELTLCSLPHPCASLA